jgi:hypothetical protein
VSRPTGLVCILVDLALHDGGGLVCREMDPKCLLQEVGTADIVTGKPHGGEEGQESGYQ